CTGSKAGLSFALRNSSSFWNCSWVIVGILEVSSSLSEKISVSCFLPLSFTYCIGLKVISFFGKTAKRKEFCSTAENRSIYPLLMGFEVVPSRFVPPYLRK